MRNPLNSYKELPDQARVWIYQAERTLTDNETDSIKAKAAEFVTRWAAHGEKLIGAIEVFHLRFIFVFVDEERVEASGCSIDSMFRFIRSLEADLGVKLLDSMAVTFRQGDRFVTCNRQDFKNMLDSGEIDADTIVFNNLVRTKREFETGWEIPLRESWHARLMA